MSIQKGGQVSYPEYRTRYSGERSLPVIWHWRALANELASTEHTEYGTLTLAMPSGVNEVLPGMSLTIQVVPPGGRTTPHSHSWWHLYVVHSGTGSLIFDELPDAAGLEAADLVLIPAWSVHHFENREAPDDLVLLSMTNLPQQAILSNLLSREFSDETR